MRVGLLGDLSIEIGGEQVMLGASNARKGFIYLALHPGRVVTSDRLCHAVWGEAQPSNVERAVHSLVYRMRHQLSPHGGLEAPVVKRGPGYVLEIALTDIDVHVFESRLDTAHHLLGTDVAAGRRMLASALELWRGEPMLEVAHEPWALAEARRLCERYIAARESMARCDLELGNFDRAIAELKGLTVSYPLRESLWALLWEALAETKRYSEIVTSHRRCARLLADEFDLAPSLHLDDLANELSHAVPR